MSTHPTTTRQAGSFRDGTQWQDVHTGEWLQVFNTKPAGDVLVRLYCTNERGEIVTKVMARTAHRVVAA